MRFRRSEAETSPFAQVSLFSSEAFQWPRYSRASSHETSRQRMEGIKENNNSETSSFFTTYQAEIENSEEEEE